MKKTHFIHIILSIFIGASMLNNKALSFNGLGNKVNNNNKISFGICTDAHQDLFPKVEERLAEFTEVANKKEVDFIIQLGDFCFPKESNKNFLSIWNSFKGKNFHVLGNHDMDKSTKEETLEFWGVDETKPYYSFDIHGCHFIVLDPNNIYKFGQFIPYENGNYFNEGNRINYIDTDQLKWLKEDLAKTKNPTILFSHQPMNRIKNKSEVSKILNNANTHGSKKIIAWFSGHEHKNWHIVKDSINHIQINSLSYLWVGADYAYEARYSEEMNKQYPVLKMMIPYKDPLYAFVNIDLENKTIEIEGKSSEFTPPGPEELGIKKDGDFAPSASIDSRVIFF